MSWSCLRPPRLPSTTGHARDIITAQPASPQTLGIGLLWTDGLGRTHPGTSALPSQPPGLPPPQRGSHTPLHTPRSAQPPSWLPGSWLHWRGMGRGRWKSRHISALSCRAPDHPHHVMDRMSGSPERESSGPVWATKRVQGQPGQLSGTLSELRVKTMSEAMVLYPG